MAERLDTTSIQTADRGYWCTFSALLLSNPKTGHAKRAELKVENTSQRNQ